MKAVRRRDTSCEIAVRSALHRSGLRYRVDAKPLANKAIRADIVFSKARVAVFIDGCFWHGCPLHATKPKSNTDWWEAKLAANADRDTRANCALEEGGWLPLRFWEHENPATVAAAIAYKVAARAADS
jgi:DNA mismatch endonuclease (patch repair protein)